jgi:hypothetical protein
MHFEIKLGDLLGRAERDPVAVPTAGEELFRKWWSIVWIVQLLAHYDDLAVETAGAQLFGRTEACERASGDCNSPQRPIKSVYALHIAQNYRYRG